MTAPEPVPTRTAIARFARESGVICVWMEHDKKAIEVWMEGSDAQLATSEGMSPSLSTARITGQAEFGRAPKYPELNHLVEMLRTLPAEHDAMKAVFMRHDFGVTDRCALAMRYKGIYVGVLYRPGAPVVKSLKRWCRRILRNEARSLGRVDKYL